MVADSWQTPMGEYVVLVPHSPRLFKLTSMGTQSTTMRHPVFMWLNHNIGYRAREIDPACSEFPWRDRVWSVGDNGQHAFFFHRRAHAMLFKLTWGGSL